MLIAANFPPKGWALCNGQLLPINQNQALFSLLGTQYGGNGSTNFALPNLQGRVVVHAGQGPGLSPRVVGERSGEQAHTLLLTETPAHTHVARGSSAAGTVVAPANTVVPARNAAQIPEWGTTVNAALGAVAMTSTGGSQPHENMQPYLCLNYVIAVVGIYPSQ